jgi:hypothetical protein
MPDCLVCVMLLPTFTFDLWLVPGIPAIALVTFGLYG